MSVRRFITGATTASLAAASVALMAPAHADPSFMPLDADIVGVGSDTSQFALAYLAEGRTGIPGYNAGKTAARLVSFDATGGGTVTLKQGAAAITRPNGSSAGKALLFGAGNNADVDYARSSSAISATEKSNGLFAFPFAKDTLTLATAKVSNAPATIAPVDMVKIYNGAVTNWSQLGGAPGLIAPKIPQAGSGTRSFFTDQLKAANGGTTVALAPSVVEVQEHDATTIKDDPNAVAPFSVGRNAVDGSPLRIEGGFVAARALYNVVRQSAVGDATILGLFGADGFVCSVAAKPLIEAAGFEQLARPAKGGVCGQPTQDASSNFATNVEVATSTTLAGTSTVGGTATLTATITASTAPDGLVNFYEGTVLVGSSPLTGAKATKALTGLTAGAHTFVAKYVPSATSTFVASESAPATVNVLAVTPVPVAKAPTKLVEKFKARYAMARSYQGKVLVKETASGASTGKVVVKLGKKVVGKGTVKAGKVVLKLKRLKKGANKLTVIYAGDSSFAGSKMKFKITVT